MKKIILLYLVLQLSHSLVNAQVEIGSTISTVGGKGEYATHIDSLGRGGFMVLPSIATRDSIPLKRRKQGMLVYVQSVDVLYKLNSASLDNTWLAIGLSSSVDVARFLSYAKLSDSLFIRGNSIMDSNLYVKGQGRFDSILTINDSLRVNGNVLIDSNLTVLGKLSLNTALQFNDSLIVTKGARIDQSILAKSKLYVSDSILAKGNVLIDSNLTVLGKLSLNTALQFNDSLIVTKGARIDQSILAKSKLYVSDSILAKGNVKIDSNLFVKGLVQLDSSLLVKNKATINDSLVVKGNASISGDLWVKNHNINDSVMKYSTSKLNVSDTSAMLLAYLNKINNLYVITSATNSSVALKLNKADTITLSDRIELRVKYTDTALMLSKRFARDTAYLSYRINSLVTSSGDLATSKLRIIDTNYLVQKADTAAWISSRFKRDTAYLALRVQLLEQQTLVNNALKIDADTAYKYFLQKKDTISLSNRIDAVVAASNVMQSDIKVNFGGGAFGKYLDGETIPSKGKTIDEVLKDIITKTIPPYYTPPSASLSMGVEGVVEIGTNLGTLTFVPTFTKNLGGNFSSITFYKNNSNVATNNGSTPVTDVVGQLLATKTYKVIYSYAAGTTVLKNNLGINDETLQVTAGNVESNTITITPGSYKYWGITTKTSSNLTDADILAMDGGGQEWATEKGKGAFTISNTSGLKQFAYYAYPAALGDITEIWSGGFESKGGFNKITKAFINASGAPVNYIIYIQKEVNGGTGNLTFSSIN